MKKRILSIMLGLLLGGNALTAYAAPSDGAASSNVDVVFNQNDTIELSLSADEINFGDVTGVSHTETTTPSALVASVKSSLPYNLDIQALSNFTEQGGGTQEIGVDKLGVKLDSSPSYTKFAGLNQNINLVTGAPATYDLDAKKQDYTLSFDLDNTIGRKTGTYKATLQVTATQN